jgi:uncharacterized membrane protein
LPIIFPIVGLIVLAVGIGFKSEVVKRTAYLVFSIGAITAAIAMNSGEGAEEIAENLPGVTDNLIHEHEEAAELFALLSYVFGAFAIFALWSSWKSKSYNVLLSYIVTAFAIVLIFLGKQTGTTGGEIRHTEIRSSSAVDQNSQVEHDDED